MDVTLLLLSFCVDILIGLTSMGGAALMGPFLIMVAGVSPVTAVGTDLVYGAVTKIVGAWAHLRNGTVDLGVVRRLAMGSIPGGIVGSLLVILLPRLTDERQRLCAEEYRRSAGAGRDRPARPLCKRLALGGIVAPASRVAAGSKGCVAWGTVVGVAVGATSIGSGSLLAPFLLMLCPSNTSRAVGTDVFHAAVLVSVTGLAHAASGGVEWNLIPTLLAGSIPGVLIGSNVADLVPAAPLRTGVAALLFIPGCTML